MELDADLVEEFVLETRETIDVVEATLIQVNSPADLGELAEVVA